MKKRRPVYRRVAARFIVLRIVRAGLYFVSGVFLDCFVATLLAMTERGGAEVFGVWINKILNTAHSVIKGVCYEKR